MLVTVLLAVAPVASATMAAIIVIVRRPGPLVRSGVQHFAAGLVMTAVATEVLPDVLDQPIPVPVIGVSLGIAAMLGLRWMERRLVGAERRGLPLGLLALAAADFAIDGFVIGVGLLHGEAGGILLGIALAVEAFFLALSVALELADRTSRAVLIGLTVAVALPLPVTLATTVLLLAGLPEVVFGTVLAFASVSLLYLVTEELLVEAHETRETPITVSLFFVGLLAFVILEGLARG